MIGFAGHASASIMGVGLNTILRHLKNSGRPVDVPHTTGQ
ncbi:IS1-like element transposase [Shigella flexneri]